MVQILATGINYTTGELLFDPIDEQVFADRLEESVVRNSTELQNMSQLGEKNMELNKELRRGKTPRPALPEPNWNDPKEVGWTFLISSKDPRRNEIINVIRPLAEHRGMKSPDNPLLFNGEPMDSWSWNNWIELNYKSIPMNKRPYYILIVGGPDQIPFTFQSLLGIAPSIGRIDFNFIEDLDAYVKKVIRLEKSNSPIVNPETLFFATDEGLLDPTHFSRIYMAEPLAKFANGTLGFKTQKIFGEDATKKKLLGTLIETKAALIYTASHGIGDPDQSLEIQKRINGAIRCQKEDKDIPHEQEEFLFSADDIPLDDKKPFLEGSVFFQFACFGYGTSKESVNNHWLNRKSIINAEKDFISAIPKRLLSHPRGPIGFIGHVNLALMKTFYDSGQQLNRLEPFEVALNNLIGKRWPEGRSLIDMSNRLASRSIVLAGKVPLLQNNEIPNTLQFRSRLTSDFIDYDQAKNFLIFGDPAARLLID